MKKLTKKNLDTRNWESKIKVLVMLVFVVSRLHIWFNRPMQFSEIIYSYMPYAHLWAGGTKPYLEQWYEYPPATIPLFYVPHLIDMATRYMPVHIDYLHAYRGEILVVDILLFALIWFSLLKAHKQNAEESGGWEKQKVSLLKNWAVSLVYYCGVTSLANHFIYDSMDWTFAAALSAAAALPLLLNAKRPSLTQHSSSWLPQLGFVFGWIGYFLATALKYVNAPIGLPQMVTELPQFSERFTLTNIITYIKAAIKPLILFGISLGIGAALIWGAPVLLYRSSLQVSLLFHQLRGLQVDTPAALFVRTVNELNKPNQTEKIIEIYKNYEVSGPLSTQVLHILEIALPLSLLVWGIGVSWLLLRNEHKPLVRAWVTLGFILVFMLTSKVLSRPFLLWHIPLLALIPFNDWKKQLTVLSMSVAMIWVSYYPVSNDAYFGLPLPVWVGWARTTLIVTLLWQWWQTRKTFLN
jgi:hypothetical protein